METTPLIVIAGPTASGKTRLAIELAEQFGGEIICADSRTVYRGMDIGTAKPTKEEQARVPHWGLDLVSPDQRFTAADFKRYADFKIADIRARGSIPFLVGGTGLYIDGIIFDFKFGPAADMKQRQELEKLTLGELHKYCQKNNILLPENAQNKRYVIRAIEQKNINVKRRNEPIAHITIVGIATERGELRSRISERAEHLFEDGVVEEAKALGKKYGWDSEAMSSNIYPLCRQYLDGELSLEQLKQKFEVADWRLAKRQLTWLRRNQYVNWLSLPEAKTYLSHLLASEH